MPSAPRLLHYILVNWIFEVAAVPAMPTCTFSEVSSPLSKGCFRPFFVRAMQVHIASSNLTRAAT